MSIAKKLEEHLIANKVKYERIVHEKTFTSQETAQVERVPGRQMAKVVMVKVDKKDVMVVVPAPERLNTQKLKRILKAKDVRLATEKEFEELFPQCEKGAMPPFGGLYNLPLYADLAISENDKIVFNAGTHVESIKMSFRDYEKLARPTLADLIEARG